MSNPEDVVIDVIDQLVDESLSRGQTDGYDVIETCDLCGQEWHGLAEDGYGLGGGCPGAFATEEQREQFHKQQPSPSSRLAGHWGIVADGRWAPVYSMVHDPIGCGGGGGSGSYARQSTTWSGESAVGVPPVTFQIPEVWSYYFVALMEEPDSP